MRQNHTCPHRELVFEYHNEVVDRILHDHPEHADIVAGIETTRTPPRSIVNASDSTTVTRA